jgi:hypothetical protein
MRIANKPLWINPSQHETIKTADKTKIGFGSTTPKLPVVTHDDMLLFKRWAVITTEEAWHEVYNQYMRGQTVNLDVYQVNPDVLEQLEVS